MSRVEHTLILAQRFRILTIDVLDRKTAHPERKETVSGSGSHAEGVRRRRISASDGFSHKVIHQPEASSKSNNVRIGGLWFLNASRTG